MILLQGIGTSSYIAVGKVRKVEDKEDMKDIKGGEIVVISKASRDMLNHLQRAGGVVTDYGGLTSHVAIVLREMKIPCVVGTESATQMLEEGMIITLDGRTGNIYAGFIERDVEENLMELHHPATSLKVNLNIPEIAERISPLADGVGSIRIENIIIRTGKHPQLLQKQDMLMDVIKGGVAKIADAFYPKPVWFRTFDIPTDELTHLDGGESEPQERNPLLGMRGISKDLRNPPILEAEFEAILQLKEEGYDNLGVKIPFLRDISEYEQAKTILSQVGIKPHKEIPLGVAIETPSAIFSLDKLFREGVDFCTIGMSDLTMCALAVDRRGVKVSKNYDLMHPAVLEMVKMVIDKCSQENVESCVCGHAASQEKIVRKLVSWGISSISTNPDQILRMRKVVAAAEEKILRDGFIS